MSDTLFASKADTLATLAGRLRCGRLLPQTAVLLSAWRTRRNGEIVRVLAAAWASGHALIVRSSARGEDSHTSSQAGRFKSIAGVVGRDALACAIDQVFASYGPSLDEDDHVLIQPFLEDVAASGVAASREIGSGRPYIVINWSEGANTAEVTSGCSNENFVHYHFRGALNDPPGRLGAVTRLLRELEQVAGHSRLDVEFAFLHDDAIPVLLQARPLAQLGLSAPRRDVHTRSLHQAENRIRAVLEAHPLAPGKRSVLGVMPDWNPAEMIGMRPRPLALSLYRALVTDETWARQRQSYGYRDLRGCPLLIDILGQPFIDVRSSFDSFMPSAISDASAERLADLYIDRLIARPELHDKVEFEIVVSAYSFTMDERLNGLIHEGLSPGEAAALGRALHALTAQMMDPKLSPRAIDRTRLEELALRRERLMASHADPLTRAYWLLEDCKRFGTRPFAGLARVGFVAIELLNSMAAIGAISPEARAAFLANVDTVASSMQSDFAAMPRKDFLRRYGHLRPGAYDILSPRYDEAPELYFGRDEESNAARASKENGVERAANTTMNAQDARNAVIDAARHLLPAHGFNIPPEHFADFLAEGVRERESAKFAFTRNLSDALKELTVWGASVGLSLDDLSYANIILLRELYASAHDPLAIFHQSIHRGREAYQTTIATCLPPLIVSPSDVWSFTLPRATPNFVTARTVRGPVAADLTTDALEGAIVLIANADPGYDWIFAHRPAGLITAYGGANSHMAIRAAELELPAVIGAGEQLFGAWSKARALYVDCANRRVEIAAC